MTNAIDCNILVWELTTGSFTRVDPMKVKDLEWDKKSCIYAWDTIGVWPGDCKETDINCVSVSNDKQLIAVGDNLGRPRIFCYPAYLQKQAYSILEGHVSSVKAITFTPDDQFLITIGENDCSIMIWSYRAGYNGEGSPININIGNKKDASLNEKLE